MDRGGCAQCAGGVNVACVFDGVTAGGRINVFAAQAFADYTLNWLVQNRRRFKQGAGVNDGLARAVFSGAIEQANNPKWTDPACDGEGGSATGVFAVVEQCDEASHHGYLTVSGAVIGDAAAILLCGEREEAQLISSLAFRRKDGRDTGGQLTLGMGIFGEIWSFSCPMGFRDRILLCTDGLLDNIRMSELGLLLPLIIGSTFFDGAHATHPRSDAKEEERPLGVAGADAPAPEPGKRERGAGLPTAESLGAVLHPWPRESACAVPCDTAVRRLFNYVCWVTHASQTRENEYYDVVLEMKELSARRATMQSGVATNPFEAPVADDAAAIDARLGELAAQKKALQARNRANKVGKTDDAILSIFSPLNDKHVRSNGDHSAGASGGSGRG